MVDVVEVQQPSTVWEPVGTYGGGLRTGQLGTWFAGGLTDAQPLPDNPTEADQVAWWARRLMARLEAKQKRLNLLEAYYRGYPPGLPCPTGAPTATYAIFESVSKVGWARLVVEAARRRMLVDGFRAVEQDDLVDAEAARIWRRNKMARKAAQLHRAQLALGEAYAIVGINPAARLEVPAITVEDPRECITENDPLTGEPVAALKVWRDTVAQRDHAVLFLPGVVWRLEREATVVGTDVWSNGLWYWGQWRATASTRTRSNRIPVVWFPNEVDLGSGPDATAESEFEPVIPTIDRAMLLVFERVVVAVHQAFRQRAALGTFSEDEKGTPIDWQDILRSDPGALWAIPPGVTMWESAVVDLTPILTSVERDVIEIAAITSTPLYYLQPSPQNGSAEGAAVQREALVAKVEDKQAQNSDPWAEVMALAMAGADQDRTDPSDWEVVWRDANRYSLAERFDAASKASAAGVPWRTVMTEVLQFTPEQVARMQGERAADALLTSLTDVAAQPRPPAAQPVADPRQGESSDALL